MSDNTRKRPPQADAPKLEAFRVENRGDRIVVVDSQGRIHEHCARYLERLAVRGLSRFTVEAYAYDLAIVYRWLTVCGLLLENLDSEQVHQRSWRGSGVGRVTRGASTAD